jgi:hypothetical protein
MYRGFYRWTGVGGIVGVYIYIYITVLLNFCPLWGRWFYKECALLVLMVARVFWGRGEMRYLEFFIF